MKISDLCAAMDRLAPFALSEPWDNTGLVVGSPDDPLRGVLLCVDVDDRVIAEALAAKIQAIVSYHPPIFEPLKRLDSSSPAAARALALARSGLAVVTTHTALDAAAGGTNDHLASLIGAGRSRPLVEAIASEALPSAIHGQGRLLTLDRKQSTLTIARALRSKLGAQCLTICAPRPARTHNFVGICTGSGAALLPKAAAEGATLFVTGEMKHHDVLDAQAMGVDLICAGHTETERACLPSLAARLKSELPGLRVQLSRADRPPLRRL